MSSTRDTPVGDTPASALQRFPNNACRSGRELTGQGSDRPRSGAAGAFRDRDSSHAIDETGFDRAGTGLNLRLNPNNGLPVDGNGNAADGINPDGSINGQPAGSTGVTAAAYTNSFGQSLTGGVTTQYVLDPVSNMLFIQNPPNNGL